MVIVGRGIREGFAGAAVDREAASAQDIGILGVAGDVAGGVDADKTGDSIEVASGGEGGGVADAIDVKGGEGGEANSTVVEGGEGGEGGEGNAEDFGFFACFVRTCSCNLVLLSNLPLQRLHV